MHSNSRRLVSVDVLRGLAALAVVFFHLVTDGGQQAPTLLRPVLFAGYLGVYLFFVISGFCIHLQWARQKQSGAEPSVRFIPFWKRRIRRLYPPYLVALLFYVAVNLLERKLVLGPRLAANIGIHLLMLHNLSIPTAYAFCGVFWTLALEEQLYLAYFALLPLRNRFGWAGTLGLLLALRLGWNVVGRGMQHHFPWWPGLEFFLGHWFTWSLGALAVEAALGVQKLPGWMSSGWVAAGCLTVAMLLKPEGHSTVTKELFYLLWVLGFFFLLNASIANEKWLRDGAIPIGRWLAGVGTISYSLYLMHQSVIVHLAPHLPYSSAPLLLLLVLLVSTGYFLLVERPFMNPPASAR